MQVTQASDSIAESMTVTAEALNAGKKILNSWYRR